ncbi:NAD(P)/FAD-dependent oxidoreductase [Planctomonas deserti]|uniref:NAD(P)/FAD-dependent oxidoreductase n=1 Tax=Planctomonas deserti TaxID=2144185 RepID=UPI001F0C14AE|nr:NAD(P)/FAD-dependent oxidoreductase [Planctomonas deserti]
MYDVVVIGGGGAGLSAALTLARSRRTVLVVDDGSPRNAAAEGIHGLLTRDGMDPVEFVRVARAEIESYGTTFREGRAEGVSGNREYGFSVTLDDGDRVEARRLIVATGLLDELPEIAGVAARWGRDVLHCPYCHGWETRERALAVIATAPAAWHQALLLRSWSDDVTLLLNDAFEPTEEQWDLLTARGVRVVRGGVASVQVSDDALSGVLLDDGRSVPCRAAFLGPRVRARSELLADIGVTTASHPDGLFEHIESEGAGETSVPGIWVAGNITDITALVVTAMADGSRAAIAVDTDLMLADAQAAARRARE